jgi:hypothetical protein
MVWAANISVFQRALQESSGQELADVVEECRDNSMLGASYKSQVLGGSQLPMAKQIRAGGLNLSSTSQPLTSFCR